jgi:hypothetical protein
MREKVTGEPCEWSTSFLKKRNVFLHWYKRKELHDRKYDLTLLCVLKAGQLNPLKPTSSELHLKVQFVPGSKHIPSRL